MGINELDNAVTLNPAPHGTKFHPTCPQPLFFMTSACVSHYPEHRLVSYARMGCFTT